MKNACSFAFLLFFLACDSGKRESPATSDTPAENVVLEKPTDVSIEKVEIEDDRYPLILNGLYASSSDPSTDVRNIFDNNQQAIWKTRKGAGPDEGIMLYFSKETNIQSLNIEGVEGPGLSKISSITVYVNGAPFDVLMDEFTAEINMDVLSLYLRFSTEENITKTSAPISQDLYSKINKERFDANQQIAVKSITITGLNGEYKVVAPTSIKGDVAASSTLNAESFAYNPSLLFDARKEFVWVEGAQGNGEGVTLRFSFEKEITIAGLRIWNGYQRSESHFKSNARLKVFSFGVAEDSANEYVLKDEQGAQNVKLKTPLKANQFQLKIQSAYKGWSYKDLAISEILFFDEAGALFSIESPKIKANQSAIIQKSKGTILEGLLDSRIFNAFESEEYEIISLTRSAIFRSDGTFVLYDQEVGEESDSETIADGNWEVLEADAESATISVFGKFLDFTLLEMFYAGKTDAEMSRIFRDKITISNHTIKGEKLVNAIQF